jgi:hypothetical protein
MRLYTSLFFIRKFKKSISYDQHDKSGTERDMDFLNYELNGFLNFKSIFINELSFCQSLVQYESLRLFRESL